MGPSAPRISSVEIVRPGTGDPVPDGRQVGELVVTPALNPGYPFCSARHRVTCRRSAPTPRHAGAPVRAIAGWMGRADQRTKIKGMFVDPGQVSEILTRHPEKFRSAPSLRRDPPRRAGCDAPGG